MQKMIQEAITLLPQSPNFDLETESKKPPFSSLDDDRKEANKIESEETAHKSTVAAADRESEVSPEEKSSGSLRERLKRHRVEVAGRVWIPEMWGQEKLLKDWIDCAAFDSSIVNSSIMSARASLIGQGRRENSTTFTIENSC